MSKGTDKVWTRVYAGFEKDFGQGFRQEFGQGFEQDLGMGMGSWVEQWVQGKFLGGLSLHLKCSKPFVF